MAGRKLNVGKIVAALEEMASFQSSIIDRKSAARMLGVNERTLLRWHRSRRGPRRTYHRNGTVSYNRQEIEACIALASGKRLARHVAKSME